MKHFYGIPKDGRIIIYDQTGKQYENNQIPDALGHEIKFGSNSVTQIQVTYFFSFLKDEDELKAIVTESEKEMTAIETILHSIENKYQAVENSARLAFPKQELIARLVIAESIIEVLQYKKSQNERIN